MKCTSILNIDYQQALGFLAFDRFGSLIFVAFFFAVLLFNLTVIDIKNKKVNWLSWVSLFILSLIVFFLSSMLKETLDITNTERECYFLLSAFTNVIIKMFEIVIIGVLLVLVSVIVNSKINVASCRCNDLVESKSKSINLSFIEAIIAMVVIFVISSVVILSSAKVLG
ncbi:hypothetical protein L4D09_27655 [Photobacterium makurazakiensis]|uniref:hypothetical protein n=1 Tax=Photobacterium makurazakiensis TaxID=2910234 RepID=UPI003D0D011A